MARNNILELVLEGATTNQIPGAQRRVRSFFGKLANPSVTACLESRTLNIESVAPLSSELVHALAQDIETWKRTITVRTRIPQAGSEPEERTPPEKEPSPYLKTSLEELPYLHLASLADLFEGVRHNRDDPAEEFSLLAKRVPPELSCQTPQTERDLQDILALATHDTLEKIHDRANPEAYQKYLRRGRQRLTQKARRDREEYQSARSGFVERIGESLLNLEDDVKRWQRGNQKLAELVKKRAHVPLLLTASEEAFSAIVPAKGTGPILSGFLSALAYAGERFDAPLGLAGFRTSISETDPRDFKGAIETAYAQSFPAIIGVPLRIAQSGPVVPRRTNPWQEYTDDEQALMGEVLDAVHACTKSPVMSDIQEELGARGFVIGRVHLKEYLRVLEEQGNLARERKGRTATYRLIRL